MGSFIIFIVFAAILYVAVAGGIGLWIATEKGRNKWLAFAACAILPVIGHILFATVKATDTVIAKEMYDRQLVSLKEYKTLEATIETKVKSH